MEDRFKFRCYDKGLSVMHEYLGRLEDVHDNQVLMQCTGLKDQTGKLIYESDVVKYYDSYQVWLTTDVFWTGAAMAVRTYENPILLDEFTNQYIYDGHNINEIEVIGNIHENPELLEKK